MKTLEYRNRFFFGFFWLLFFGSVNRSHCIGLKYKSRLRRDKYTKYWLLIQDATFGKQVAYLAARLLI